MSRVCEVGTGVKMFIWQEGFESMPTQAQTNHTADKPQHCETSRQARIMYHLKYIYIYRGDRADSEEQSVIEAEKNEYSCIRSHDAVGCNSVPFETRWPAPNDLHVFELTLSQIREQ